MVHECILGRLAAVADQQQHGASHAALACTPHKPRDHISRSHGNIAIGQRQQVVLRTTERQHALVHGLTALGDNLGHLGGTHEGHSTDIGVVAHGSNHLRSTVHDLEHTRRNARSHHQLHHSLHGQGNLLRGLENHTVAHGEGNGDRPHGNHRREVERHDGSHHAQRLSGLLAHNAAGHLQLSTSRELGKTGGPFNGLVTLGDISKGLRKVLAVLAHDDGGKFSRVGVHQTMELEHNRGSGLDSQTTPGGERFSGGLDRFVNVRRSGSWDGSDLHASGGGNHVNSCHAGGHDKLSVDKIGQHGHLSN
mmetsp:Transcript_62735/g.110801  ORF Transcript_62735/g.110801 Transcript_62735/m.110801 type:complete len:307 (+) Transcript_62735:1762-2682(+)